MIIDIRRQLKSSAYRYVVIVAVIGIIISFALPPVIKQIGRDSEWVISVNGSEIFERDFRHAVAQQQEFLIYFKQKFGPYYETLLASMGMGQDPRQMAFNILVKNELLLQVAKKIGIVIHKDDITDKLTNPQFVQQELASIIPPYFISEQGTINEKALRRYLQKSGIPLGQFELLVEQAVTRQLVLQLCMLASYVPLFDIKQRYITDFVAKKYSILTFSLDSYIAQEKKSVASAQELQEFFDAQNSISQRYVIPEKRAGITWTFDPSTYGFKVSEKEVEAYYEEHKAKDFVEEPTKVRIRRILLKIPDMAQIAQVEERARAIRQDLGLGDAVVSFEQKAREVSEDAQTAKQGGLMPYFSRGQQNAAIDRIAFLLKEDGEISPVFRSDDGFEVIQRIHKKMRTFVPLSKVSTQIRKELAEHKFKAQFITDMKALVTRPGDVEAQISSFIKDHGGKKQSVAPMLNDQSLLAKALFSINKPDDFEFYVDGENGVAVQLTELQKQFTPTLTAVKDQVLYDIYQKRALIKMKADISQAQQEITTGKDQATVASEYQTSVEKTGWIKADNSKQIKEFESRQMPVGKMLQMEKVGQCIADTGDRASYLICLDEIEPIDQDHFNREQSKIRGTLEQERLSLTIEGLIASLYRTATIKTNESVLNLYQEYSI